MSSSSQVSLTLEPSNQLGKSNPINEAHVINSVLWVVIIGAVLNRTSWRLVTSEQGDEGRKTTQLKKKYCENVLKLSLKTIQNLIGYLKKTLL